MGRRRTVRGYSVAEWNRLATLSDAVGLRAYLRLAVVRNAVAIVSGSLAGFGFLKWWPELMTHGPTATAIIVIGVALLVAGASAAVVHPFALALALRTVDPTRMTVQPGDRELREKFTRMQIKAALVAAAAYSVLVVSSAFLFAWLMRSPLYAEWQWLVGRYLRSFGHG
jgi:hypothetical protein